MLFLSVTLQKINAPTLQSTALCWVNEDDPNLAAHIARQAFAAREWTLLEIVENAPTHCDDYFPPCLSHEAFLRAEQSGFACRIAWEENAT